MGLIDTIRKKVSSLLTSPAEELNRWARFARYQIQLWRFCMRRLRENDSLAMSSALSFRTLFAMVPILVLVLILLQAIGTIEGSELVDRFLSATGLAEIELSQSQTQTAQTAPAVNLAEVIHRLVRSVEQKLNVGVIGPVGVLLLVWTATTLMSTMEGSLNRVFDAPRPRSLWRRVFMYWSVLTLGPVVIAAGLYMGRQLLDSAGQIGWLSWPLSLLGWAGPLLVQLAVLTMVYRLLPNKAVPLRAAVGGAIIAGPLWLVAKWAFQFYVVTSLAKGNIYGTLGLLPMFLIWLNLSWWIFLFGAQLAHVAVNLGRMTSAQEARRVLLTSMDLLAAAVAVWREHEEGRGPATMKRLQEAIRLPDVCIRRLTARLEERGLLSPVDTDEQDTTWAPARPAAQVSVTDLLEGLPDSKAGSDRYEPATAAVLETVRQRGRSGLEDLSLADLLEQQDREE